jgi:polysaccharide export outer membrane protein
VQQSITPPSHLLIAILGFLVLAPMVSAREKDKYVMPPPEFFQPRNVSTVIIQPGDTITVNSYYNSELSRTIRVREDGKISLPLLQGIQAGGLTPEQLQTVIASEYSHEFMHPGITVDLISPANNAVYVTGEVGMPGPKEIRGRMTVAMALASAQILDKSGKPKSTFLVRSAGAGHYIVYKLDASFPSGSAASIEVVAGDVLFVPKKAIAKADDFIDLWVRQLVPATPSANTSVLFTPGNATTLATTVTK